MSDSKCRRLEGRVAVVTGGASGIGLATVRRFADEGATVVIGDLDPNSGEAAASSVDGLFVRTDVTNADDVANMFDTAKSTYGSVDIAFNNAGISPPDDDSILETGIDAWRRVQEVNLTSVYLCCKEVLPYMLEQGKGSIINIASIAGANALGRGHVVYGMGMAAIIQMTRDLSTEWSGRGVRVNAILPAQVTNPGLHALWAADPAIKETMLRGIPIGRFGAPDDIKGLALLLASDASAWITGALIPFDGGNLAMNAGGTASLFRPA